MTSAPISAIANSGRYSALQDLVDGYASEFEKVFVVSPRGAPVIVPNRAHRIRWFSGPGWLPTVNGLMWAAIANRHKLRSVELVRSFGLEAGLVGRILARYANSPHVSSPDDLVENLWRYSGGKRSLLSAAVARFGLLKADLHISTQDWEVEYLADAGYWRGVILGTTGLATDYYTPVSNTDPNRHPVVLWADKIASDKAIEFLVRTATLSRTVVPGVEFVVVALPEVAPRLKASVDARHLPVTVVSFEKVEPFVDLVERTWVCVTVPRSELPHGLGMLALSAGVPMISAGKLSEKHGFANHRNYIGTEPYDHVGATNVLGLLRRWNNFALRIGSAGQRLVEGRFSTRSVANQEAELLARIAHGDRVETVSADAVRRKQERQPDFLADIELFESQLQESADDAPFDIVNEDKKSSARNYTIAAPARSDSPVAKFAQAGGSAVSPIMNEDDAGAISGDASTSTGGGVSANDGAKTDRSPKVPEATDFESKGVDNPEFAEPTVSFSEMDHDAISALFADEDQSQPAA
ncbi:MAG: glycosyltransferase [Chloroflexi bacterium]|nr:glycosyltransferase [Chloroflexota bacterium]